MTRLTTSLLLSAALIAAPATALAQSAPAAPAAPADAPKVSGSAAGAQKAGFFSSGNLVPLAGVAAVAAAGVIAATVGGGDDEAGPPVATSTTTSTATTTN